MTVKRPWYRSSTFWIFVGLILGVVLGGFLPQDQYPWAYDTFRFLSKAFISLIKGLIVPLLLSTIIVGIAQTGDIRAVGRMGAKALIYFEVITTLALVVGLVAVNIVRPGVGVHLQVAEHAGEIAAKSQSFAEVITHIVPQSVVEAAAASVAPTSQRSMASTKAALALLPPGTSSRRYVARMWTPPPANRVRWLNCWSSGKR